MPRPAFDRLAYRDPRPSPLLIHAAGWLNRHLLLPRVLRIEEIDFPDVDVARLRALLRPGAAAFLAPNHPEYMTDWLLDKEISRRVSPLMAHWASYEVVNASPAAQWFWLRNNLIANAPGGDGRAYSLRWARAGHGVLLHPEGAPTWHGDRIAPLVPGAIEMAREAAGPGPEPSFVVPIVWKLWFRRDAAAALEREMCHVAGALGLTLPAAGDLARRFAEFQMAVLAWSRRKYAGEGAPVEAAGFFAAQSAHAESLLQQLESRHEPADGDRPRRIHRLRRSIHRWAQTEPDAARRDRAVLAEVERLSHFDEEHYGGTWLTQEQIAESLKQTRVALLKRTWRDRLQRILPVAVAPRGARIRVAEPLRITASTDPEAALGELRARLQRALDELGREHQVSTLRIANPLRAGS